MKHHKISLATAVLMSLNIMIGSGILIGPGVMAGVAGNASFITWLIVALVFLPVVLSTVAMNKMCPGAGGFYAYAREGLSKAAGFWSGWLYTVGYTFSVAVALVALRNVLLVSFGENWFTSNAILVNFVIMALCMMVNLLSIKQFGRILNSLTIFKLIPLITVILLIPFIFKSSFTISAHEFSMLPYSFPMALFGYLGFEYCCSISHLIDESEKNAPRAILIGFGLTAAIYSLFHFGLLNLMGSEALHKLGAPAFAQFITLPIPYLREALELFIPLASGLTFFAGMNGLLSANSQMLYAMAIEKVFRFSPALTQVTAANRPWVALTLQSAACFLLATLLPNISVMGSLCNIGIFLSFVLPFSSLLIIQQRTGTRGSMPLTIWSLLSTLALAIYSIYNLGTTIPERLLYLSPLMIAIVVGMLIYRPEEK